MDGDVATAPPPALLASSRMPLAGGAGVGTANAPLAYRLRDARPTKTTTSGMRCGRERCHNLAYERDRLAALRLEDERRRERRMISANISRAVERGLRAYDDDLETRRDRLRELLLREEVQLTRELVESARKLEELRAEELAAQAREAEEERECARQTLLREKRLQAFTEASQAIREARRRAWTANAKRANLAQIAAAEERRRQELENEAYWNGVMQEKCAADEARELAKERCRLDRELRNAETLRCQMEARRRLARAKAEEALAEARVRATLERNANRPEEARIAEDRAKRIKLRLDLERQLDETRQEIERRRDEERELDRIMRGSLCLDDGGCCAWDKETRRREIQAYMDNLKEFREAVARRESAAEECARGWAAAAEVRARAARLRAREEAERSVRELRAAWDRQLEDKRRRQSQLLDHDNCHHSEPPDILDKLERERRHNAALAYGRELLAQKALSDSVRARERRDIEDFYARQRVERELEERRLARELGFRS